MIHSGYFHVRTHNHAYLIESVLIESIRQYISYVVFTWLGPSHRIFRSVARIPPVDYVSQFYLPFVNIIDLSFRLCAIARADVAVEFWNIEFSGVRVA